jgi:hypothetical protein
MKSEMKRLCKMKSLRQLRSMQRENEAAREAAIGRVKSASMKVLSLSDVVMLLVKRYAPAGISRIMAMIFPFS